MVFYIAYDFIWNELYACSSFFEKKYIFYFLKSVPLIKHINKIYMKILLEVT